MKYKITAHKKNYINQKDGKFTFSMSGNTSSGTYSLSDDGKNLTTTDEGKKPEASDILECTKDKIVLKNPKNQSTLTMGK